MVVLPRRPAPVERRDVVGKLGRVARLLETEAAVVPRRVPLKGHVARVPVVDDAPGQVVERDAVDNDVVGGADVALRATELEAVAVALEGGEAPPVEAVAPGDRVVDLDARLELPVKHEYEKE